MTNSRDSSLFENEVYDSDPRQQGETDPFARALPPSAEPLFPAATWEQPEAEPALESSPWPDAADYSAPDSAPDIEVPVTAEDAPLPEPIPSAPAPAKHTHGTTEKEADYDRHFAVLMNLMQHGAWPQALEKLQAMRAEYPQASALDGLIDEATLKTELMTQWTHKIKGRRLTVGQAWLIRRSLPFLLLLAFFVGGTIFYQNLVAPSRHVIAMEWANQALIDEAVGLVQMGQIHEAIALYETVLTRDSSHNAALQGLARANRLAGLATNYDIAMQVANEGNLPRALRLLESIQANSSSFRDVNVQVGRVETLLQAEEVYKLAERAFAQRRWVDATQHYEQVQLISSDYQAERVKSQLSAAYFMAAQKLVAQWPSAEFGAETSRTFLRKAQSMNAQNETISTLLSQADLYLKGERSLNSGNLGQAINTWRKLYDEQPGFFGGFVAEQLYRAYLTLAGEVRADDPEYARELYEEAAALAVHDSSEARNQLQSLGADIPRPQPTPTPQPTVAYAAPAPAVVAAPPATATPAPAPAHTYQGWIAFRSTRDGGEQVYVMRADGSEQQLAPEALRGQLDALYQAERHAPDGRLVSVQSVAGRSDANIFVTSPDGQNTSMLTDYKRDEYDPVWSPASDWVAFVANHTGNDEIWVMRADGGEQRQLTFNNWEWDKHPTWAPDGSQIAFFSNRSGQRQIWAMGSDGSNPHNLSNNGYDDWDPVWIK